MSAELKKEDKNWLLSCSPNAKKLSDLEEALVFTSFDAQTEFDIQEIHSNIRKIKFLKKVCFTKLLLFVPEYLLIAIFFERKYRLNKLKVSKLYYNFLFNKINLKTLETQLSLLIKEGNI